MQKIIGETENNTLISISEKTTNGHVLCVGKSGSGKTTADLCLGIEDAKMGRQMVALNYKNSINHATMHPKIREEYEKYVKVINVGKDGLHLPLFTPYVNSQGVQEPLRNLLRRLVSSFKLAAKLAPTQERMLYECAKDLYKYDFFKEKGIQAIGEWFDMQDTMTAKSTLSKLSPFIDWNMIKHGNDLDCKENILEFDMNGLEYDEQVTYANYILDYIYRLAHKGEYMEKGLSFFIDEVQNLNWSAEGTLYAAINESRKLNVNLYLATTSLFNSTKQGAEILTQCGTILFFKPAKSDLRRIAEIISIKEANSWVYRLSMLQKGQCVCCGTYNLWEKKIDKSTGKVVQGNRIASEVREPIVIRPILPE